MSTDCMFVWLGTPPWEPVAGQTPCPEGTCTAPTGEGDYLYEERMGTCKIE